MARTRSTITSRAVRGRRAAAVRENPMAGLVSKASTGVRAQQAFSSPSATSRLSRNSSSHIHALLLVHDQASPVCSPSAPCRPDAFGPLGLVPGDGCERAPRSGAFAGVTLAGPRRDPVGSQPRNLQRWAWKRQRRSSEGACRPDLDARRPKGEARTAAGRGIRHRRAGAWGGRDDVGKPVPTTRVSVRLMVVRERSSTRATSVGERPVRVNRVFLRFNMQVRRVRNPVAGGRSPRSSRTKAWTGTSWPTCTSNMAMTVRTFGATEMPASDPEAPGCRGPRTLP